MYDHLVTAATAMYWRCAEYLVVSAGALETAIVIQGALEGF